MTHKPSQRMWTCWNTDVPWHLCLILHFILVIVSASTPSFPELRFTSEPSDVVVARGAPVLLNCSAQHSGAAPSMTWVQEGIPLNTEGDSRRYQLGNGSMYFESVEHTRTHKPDEGEYQCVASVPELGTIVSRKAVLTVAYLKSFSAEPVSISVYLGDTAMFDCQAEGSPTPEVRWYKDDVEIAKDNSNYIFHLDGVLEITSVQFSDLGRYKCKVENVERSRTSDSASLTQESDVSLYEGVAPRFVLVPKDRVSLEGSIVVLNCGANGRDNNGSPPTITWLKDGVTIDMDEDSRCSIVGTGSLRIDNVKEADAGSYTCRARNMEDSIDAEASVTVHVPPRFVQRPQNVAAQLKSEAQFDCEVVGVPKPNIVWLKNGDLFTPSDYFQIIDGRNLRILGLLESDAGIYQCMAENDVGNIQASAQLIITQPGDQQGPSNSVPSEPTELSAIIVGQRFVTLSWRLPEYMGSSDLTYYSIFWKEEESHRERMLNTSALEANIQHLKPATKYVFRVLAHNSHGVSKTAAEVTVVTEEEVNVPGPPMNLQAWPESPTSVRVTFDPPSVTNGQITSYKLYYYTEGEEEQHDVNLEGHEYLLEGLLVYKEYFFSVVAYNNIGPGTRTEEVSARTFSAAPSAPPQNVSVETGSSTSIVLRWEPPPEDSRNGLITGYKIRFKEKGDRGGGESITTDANIRSSEIKDLKRGQEYQVRIQALTVNGTSSEATTQWYTAETYVHDLDESQVPGMPSSLHVRAMSTSIMVTWTAPLEQNIMVRGYTLGYGVGVPDVFKQVLDAKQRSHTIVNLRPSSSYVVSLRAFNELGEGRPIYETGETREETREEPLTPMLPPVGLKAIVLSSTTIVLTWSDTTLGRNQRITDNRYYNIRYNPKMSRKHKTVNSTDLNVHIDDLKPNTEYEFSVKVLKGRRKSVWSLSVFNKTLEAAPATAPRDLTPVAVEGKPHWVTLNWQPPRQPNGQVTGYVVFYTTDPNQKDRDWVVAGIMGDQLSTTIKDLTPETTYYFKVQARNKKGEGPMSPTVIFRTPKVDGTGGGVIELPNDYGKSNLNSNKGYKLIEHGYSPAADEDDDENGNLILWISIGCVGGVAFVLIVVVIVLCKRKGSRDRKGYKPANKKQAAKPGPKDLKPPDLWMDHESMLELKNIDGMGMTTLPEGKGEHEPAGQGYSTPSEERYHQAPYKPAKLMIPVDQPPPPREPIATAVTNGHLTIGGPESPPVIVNPTPIRPVYPRTQYPQQYTSPPRVNASDLAQCTVSPSPESPKYENSHAPISYDDLEQQQQLQMQRQQQQQQNMDGHKSLPLHRGPNPLKSFAVPGPPGLASQISAPNTPTPPKHIGNTARCWMSRC